MRGVLCYDRFPPEDREAVQQSIEMLLGLYNEDDAIVNPNEEEVKNMQPRPLSARFMPPLEIENGEDTAKQDEDDNEPKNQQKAGGFGAGGMGKKTDKKKKEKKKVKARNALKSDNPKFKSGGKTPYANRK